MRARAVASCCTQPFTPYRVTRGISSLDMDRMDASAVFVMLLDCFRKFGGYRARGLLWS